MTIKQNGKKKKIPLTNQTRNLEKTEQRMWVEGMSKEVFGRLVLEVWQWVYCMLYTIGKVILDPWKSILM